MTLLIPLHRNRCTACGEIRQCEPLETTPVVGISQDEDPGRDHVPTPLLCVEGPDCCMGYWRLLEAMANSPLADLVSDMLAKGVGPFKRVRELFFELD